MEVRQFVLPEEHDHHLKRAGRIAEDQTATALRQELSHSLEGVEPSERESRPGRGSRGAVNSLSMPR